MKSKEPTIPSAGHLDRRTFIKGVFAAGGSLVVPSAGVFGAVARLAAISPNEKVNLACVGIGNRGADIIKALGICCGFSMSKRSHGSLNFTK